MLPRMIDASGAGVPANLAKCLFAPAVIALPIAPACQSPWEKS